MPYHNIVFIKLEKRLLDDHRWYMMSEEAQLIYIKLILLAAATYNKLPLSSLALRRALKTELSHEKIESAIKEIQVNFPKFRQGKDFYYFFGFDEKTNWVAPKKPPRNPQGSPREVTEKSRVEKSRVEKSRVEKDYVDFEKSTLATWNKISDSFPIISKINTISPERRKHLKKRFENNHFKENLEKAINLIGESTFLRGQNDREWRISFDWIIGNDNNYLKVLEGKYKDRNKTGIERFIGGK